MEKPKTLMPEGQDPKNEEELSYRLHMEMRTALEDKLEQEGYNIQHLYRRDIIIVEKDSKWGAFNLEGEETIPLEYDDLGGFCDDSFCDSDIGFVGKDGKYGFINKQGEIVIPFQYDRPAIFETDSSWVKKDGRKYYIDLQGNRLDDKDRIETTRKYYESEEYKRKAKYEKLLDDSKETQTK